LRLSIIVPFHHNLDHLDRCLSGLKPLRPDAEIIVVADGAIDDCRPAASAAGAMVLAIDGPSGPAVARNRGAAHATGEILVFVDADVVASGDDLDRIVALFRASSNLAAVFGAYDEEPAEPNFFSQYKNLAHSYIHQSSSRTAQTFWAGFGAVRADVFRAMGGFDERFRRPCIEDIELGYRLTAAGHPVVLEHELRVRHLKRWTFGSVVISDVRDRGIPWTQLILRSGRVHDDLNLHSAYRISVSLSYGLLLLLLVGLLVPETLLLVPPVLAVLYLLNRRFLGYFAARRGAWFALRVVPAHFLYHLYNGFSFLVGSSLFLARRWLGVRLPGALPLRTWEGTLSPAPREPIAATLPPRIGRPEVLSRTTEPAIQHSATQD
jgi:glycosyltransferase involved in cell wall biosynthesis